MSLVVLEMSFLKVVMMSLVVIWVSLIFCLSLLQIFLTPVYVEGFLRLLWLLIRLRLKHDSSEGFFAKFNTWLVEFEAELNKGDDKNTVIVTASESTTMEFEAEI
ncbi:uncharacterized protein LOC110751697 [Prunus avium]|uniref:Uncharacterized protein LOC110751697 n=1 Tax=Prunus avium TaxID=42229 RepID=A0A6P5S363_PRUAV|nr:uncharacterized protein LOC110751697 [Prunus avium]